MPAACISKPDWDRVFELGCDVVNASSIGDIILREAKRESLLAWLDELEQKYGEHPSIVATRGDFLDDPAEAMRCFKRALELARACNDEEEEAEILDSIKNLSAQ